jgi:hypothetical protein
MSQIDVSTELSIVREVIPEEMIAHSGSRQIELLHFNGFT